MDIAFNWYNIKWKNSGLNIDLNNITNSRNGWIKIKTIVETTTQTWRWDNTNSELSYKCWVDNNNIYIQFKLQTWASNSYDDYYYSIDTKRVISNSSANYNNIKILLDNKVNNKIIFVDSDHSTSLQDYRNIPNEQIAITNLLKNSLGNYYQAWKPYIQGYAYSDHTNQATITIRFKDLNTNQEVIWSFKVTIKFNFTQNYWTKSFSERLTITPGKIIDVSSGNSRMVTDKPLISNGKYIYGTTAFIRFDGANDGSETMKVNGIPIDVINNQFTFQMTDNQLHNTNEYRILLEKHDLGDFNKIMGKYEIIYVIKQDIPKLELKWYAWDPSKNPAQKDLISPVLGNGKINPNYDSEVNIATGTKTQIVWIKHQALNPFALDPLNKEGQIINDNNYEQGFLAEAAVSGMGISQNFDDEWIKSVKRIKVDDQTLQPIGSFEDVKSHHKGGYFSNEGTYLYNITDQKEITASKFVIIGQKWENKYAKFLNVVNNSNIAVNFWNTFQGFHLKSYLVKHKQFKTIDVEKLAFEQVFSYWKEYVSNIESQYIEPIINPYNSIDLNTISLDAIKMNSNDINIIKKNVINGITKQLNKYQLEFNTDYTINNLDANLNKLLQFSSNNDVIVDLEINALQTSIKARNNTTIKIRNSKKYYPDKAVDLSKIKFNSLKYNFSKFKVDQLKKWILQIINTDFQTLKIKIFYANDYQVMPLDNTSLNNFIITKNIVKLNLIIKAQLSSNSAFGSTSLAIINDYKDTVFPPDPKIIQDKIITEVTLPEPYLKEKRKLLLWLIPTLVIIIFTLGIIIWWFYVRKMKRIK